MRSLTDTELTALVEAAAGGPSLARKAELLASLTARLEEGGSDVAGAPVPLRAFTGGRPRAASRRVGLGLGLGAWAALALGSAAAAGTWAALAASDHGALAPRPAVVSAEAGGAGGTAGHGTPGVPGAGGSESPPAVPSLTAPLLPVTGADGGASDWAGSAPALPGVEVVVGSAEQPLASVGTSEGDVVVELDLGGVVGGPLGTASCDALADPALGVVDLGALLCGR